MADSDRPGGSSDQGEKPVAVDLKRQVFDRTMDDLSRLDREERREVLRALAVFYEVAM